MTNAPERIYAFRNSTCSHDPSLIEDHDAEYIRLDLHQEALMQAREDGFAAGRESVLSGDDSE